MAELHGSGRPPEADLRAAAEKVGRPHPGSGAAQLASHRAGWGKGTVRALSRASFTPSLHTGTHSFLT